MFGGCSSVVEQWTFNPLVVGSNPTALTCGECFDQERLRLEA